MSQIQITYNGETRSVSEWAQLTNQPYDTLQKRLARGWAAEKALTTPISVRDSVIEIRGLVLRQKEWRKYLNGVSRQALSKCARARGTTVEVEIRARFEANPELFPVHLLEAKNTAGE